MELAPDLPDEEHARAVWYAIASRLFYAPADQSFLDALANTADADNAEGERAGLLMDAWSALREASQQADVNAVQGEFDSLVVGVGKAPVTPYTSAYAAPQAPDRHLLQLRSQLRDWGLARPEDVFEAEDHVSGLCDVMRWLIQTGKPVADQRAFFESYVVTGVPPFCTAIQASPLAQFYRHAALVLHEFVNLERDAFDMHLEA